LTPSFSYGGYGVLIALRQIAHVLSRLLTETLTVA
jgi:hypothetical protein